MPDTTAATPAPMPRSPARRIARWLLLGLGAILALLVLAAAVTLGPLLLEGNAYEGVPSIEARADYRNPALMEAAWSLPVARRYAAGEFSYQSNPSFCGPTSLANVLRSLGQPADQSAVIDGTQYEPWFGVLPGGMTIDELAGLAALRLGTAPAIVRPTTVADFRAVVRRSNDPRVRIIANFHRGPLFGRGHGHFSPILGYLDNRDLVLVGDTNADYRPFLVPAERLWRAIDTVDKETGRKRGLIVMTLERARVAGTGATPLAK